MADKEVSGLTAASALDGTELVHIVQSTNSRKSTTQDIADLAAGDVTSVFTRTGAVVAATSDYDAVQVDYDNTTSLLTATNVQAAIDEVSAASGGAGAIAQVVNTQTGAVATGSTLIPIDDTIPQNTEGDEYMTLAITPTNAASTLIIDVSGVWYTLTANVYVTVALFQDTTADALAAVTRRYNSAAHAADMTLRHKMTAGTTSATTFKVRVGPSASSTVTFNGLNGARFMGGVMASSITITEVLP